MNLAGAKIDYLDPSDFIGKDKVIFVVVII